MTMRNLRIKSVECVDDLRRLNQNLEFSEL